MTHRMFQLAVLVSLSSFLTVDAAAQTQTGSGLSLSQDLSIQPGRRHPTPLGAIVVTDLREQAIGLAEDTQIMGQIVQETVHEVYLQRAHGGVTLAGAHHSLDEFSVRDCSMCHSGQAFIKPALLSTFLDGYGVVYQLEAPPLHQVPTKVQVNVRPAPKSLTVWEKARRQLRGEKVESAGAASTPHTGTWYAPVRLQLIAKAPTKEQLVQKLLDVLAKNGHNFRHLAPEERLTVAITFRKQTSKSQPEKKGGLSGGSMGMMGPAVMSGEVLLRPAGVSWGTPAEKVSKSNDETTGDLHMRQEKYDAAVLSYEKALRLANIKDPYTASKVPAGYRFQQSKDRQLFEKLARSLIAATEYDKARQVLENLSRAYAAASKANQKSSLPFSAQLVVSVKKADLDAVAAGKIKGEEFRKRATVRYFDPGELPPDESKSGQENGKAKKTTNLNGVIRHVDSTSKLVWINLGALDNLSNGAVFDVYSKIQVTTKSQPTDVKGRIEVTRIIGPHLAESRILDDNLLSPIAPGNTVVAKTRSAKAK